MNETTEFYIDMNGRVFREYRQRDEIDPGDALQKVFTANVTTTARNFMELPGHGPIHVVHQQAESRLHFSVPLETIHFRTTFKTITSDEGYKDQLYPTFGGKNDATLDIEWNRADAMLKQDATMRLRFHVMVQPAGADQWQAVDHYLYAFDGRGVIYKLPFGNIYDTCQVCMGEYSSVANTALGALQKAIAQFRTAPWNADLFYNQNDIWKFVRFKALEKGFQTQPIIPAWTTMCPKVSTAFSKFCPV